MQAATSGRDAESLYAQYDDVFNPNLIRIALLLDIFPPGASAWRLRARPGLWGSLQSLGQGGAPAGARQQEGSV